MKCFSKKMKGFCNYLATYSMTLKTIPEKLRLSASAGGSVCKVMNLLVFIFLPVRFTCFLVNKIYNIYKNLGKLAH